MLIAHISDFHVFADERETHLVRLDAADAARKVVADLAAFRPKIDAVMFTGDLVDGGSPEDYELITSILAPIDAPIFAVPGNHDRRAGMRAAFADTLPFEAGKYLNYETHCGPLRIIGLDTQIEGRGEGSLELETLDWFEERLSRPTEGHTYVLMHHPSFPSGIQSLDAMSLVTGNEKFARLVRAYPGSLHILAGHIHRPYQGIWNGALVAVGGSPAFQFALDLTHGAPEPGIVNEPYCYFIHNLSSDGMSILARPVSL